MTRRAAKTWSALAAAAALAAAPAGIDRLRPAMKLERAATAALHAKCYDRAAGLATKGLNEIARLRAKQPPTGREGKAFDLLERRLELLRSLALGQEPHEVDAPADIHRALFLFRGGAVRVAPAGRSALTMDMTHTPDQPGVRIEPMKPDQFVRVAFAPADAARFIRRRGFLRFYVNSARPIGGQQPRVRLQFDAAGPGPWVRFFPPAASPLPIPFFNRVDDLIDTWQLVSIPLDLLAPPGAKRLAGMDFSFVEPPACAIVVADAYLIDRTQTVIHWRFVRP